MRVGVKKNNNREQNFGETNFLSKYMKRKAKSEISARLSGHPKMKF